MSQTPLCETCNGSGEVENSCSCHGQPPQYICNRCGDTGSVTKPCPECQDDEPDVDYLIDRARDDRMDREREGGDR